MFHVLCFNIHVIIIAKEDTGGDTNDANKAKDDEEGNKDQDHQPNIILTIPEMKIHL